MDPLGAVRNEGVIYDCPACILRLHELHLAHSRNGGPPLLCICYQLGQSKWSCGARFKVTFAEGPTHTLAEGCRYVYCGKDVARG